jgi:hypothetical protein
LLIFDEIMSSVSRGYHFLSSCSTNSPTNPNCGISTVRAQNHDLETSREMKLIQIYLDDETHTTLVKNYTIALAAAEESFTFEDYLVYLLQAVSPSLPTHAIQPPGIKEKTIKVKHKILSATWFFLSTVQYTLRYCSIEVFRQIIASLDKFLCIFSHSVSKLRL